mmetsp:Transcript_8492/g.18469  ORF Transcript_8492/g.18469 Transcript_8492/m.18469 type:complete len:363 (+) Transcript_8492:2-1090(+)
MMPTWPIPADTPGAHAAYGNEATCKTQAFFMQLGLGAPFYNLCLAIYYYLFIVKNIRPSRNLERCMHLVCFLFAFGTAIAGLATGMFGYAAFWCWITVEYNIFRYFFFHGPIWIIITSIAIIMSSIFYDLKKQEKRQRRWGMGKFKQNACNSPGQDSARKGTAQGATNNSNEDGTNKNQGSTATNGMKRKNKSRSTRASDNVKSQAFLYVGSFILTWFFLTIVRAMETAGQIDSVPYWLTLAGVTLFPIQGFFNFLIYIRPRYNQHRKQYPEVGRFVTFFRVSPLFAGWKCCHGTSICAGESVGLCGMVQRIRHRGDASESDAGRTSSIHIAPIDYNSQESNHSEQSCAEAGQVPPDNASQE